MLFLRVHSRLHLLYFSYDRLTWLLDINRLYIESGETSKKRKYKDRRLNSLLDDDTDIQAELDKGDTVNIL